MIENVNWKYFVADNHNYMVMKSNSCSYIIDKAFEDMVPK